MFLVAHRYCLPRSYNQRLGSTITSTPGPFLYGNIYVSMTHSFVKHVSTKLSKTSLGHVSVMLVGNWCYRLSWKLQLNQDGWKAGWAGNLYLTLWSQSWGGSGQMSSSFHMCVLRIGRLSQSGMCGWRSLVFRRHLPTLYTTRGARQGGLWTSRTIW